VVDEINRAVGRRWQGLDRLLPPRAELPEGCAAPFVATGANGRPAGLAACRHEHVKSGTLSQTWGTAGRFSLIARLREPDTSAALDDLMGQWRDHLADLPGSGADDTAAMITWPARDVSGVTTLLRHGLQPITVIAARPARPETAAPRPAGDASLVIREAGPADLDVVTELEMGVIRYDALFGAAILRPATEELVRAETRRAGRPRSRPAARGVALDHRHDTGRRDGVPADHVRPARRTRQRGRRGSGQACARGARRPWRGHHAAALRAAEPAVRAVLEPDGLPSAVDRMGGAAGRIAAVRRNAEGLLTVCSKDSRLAETGGGG
jgi:hypothetical protein